MRYEIRVNDKLLLISRELRTDKCFYILCENIKDTTLVFKFTATKFQGKIFCLYEPFISDFIHGLNVLSSNDRTIVPIDLEQRDFYENDIGNYSETQGEALVKSFLFSTNNIKFKRIEDMILILKGIGSKKFQKVQD